MYELGEFQHFETLLYDDKVTALAGIPTVVEYNRKIEQTKAGGSTNFVAVF